MLGLAFLAAAPSSTSFCFPSFGVYIQAVKRTRRFELEPVCSLLQNYCRATFWHPLRENHLIIYTNTCSLSHCGKLGVTWTKLEVLQPSLSSGADVRAAICPFVTALRLATVGVIDCWSGEGPGASFVSRCQMTMSTDGSDLWYRTCGLLARYITVLARPAMVTYPFRQRNLTCRYLCQINIHVRIVAMWSCCRCELQRICHTVPFPVMLSVLSSAWRYQLHLRDPAVRFLNMQLMWPFRRAVIHLPNLLIRRVWMILPFPPFWDMYANRPCFIHAWWDDCQCLLLLKWPATGNFTTLLGNFKRRGTSEDPSIFNKYAKYIFKS